MNRSAQLLSTSALALATAANAAGPATAAKSKTRACDAVVQRVVPFGQQAPVLHAATRIWVRGATCASIRKRIGTSLLQVGSAAPTPPTTCCESSWYSDDADWWRKNGWKVEKGIGANTRAEGGARFIVSRNNIRLRFTRWS